MKGLIRIKNAIVTYINRSKNGKILFLVIMLIFYISGCGEKSTVEGHVLSSLVCKKLDNPPAVSSDMMLIPEVDMEKMNDDEISESDFANVRESDPRNIIKGLCQNFTLYDYEIYATDDKDYAIIVRWYDGKPAFPYWMYKKEGEWFIETISIPDETYSGYTEKIEFHELSGLEKKIVVIQTANSQGHGNTFIFQISSNRLQCIGYLEGSVNRNRTLLTSEDEAKSYTSFYANDGRLQVDFQDINNDGFEEMLVYGRQLNYEGQLYGVEKLTDVETVKSAYQFEKDTFVEISNPQYEVSDIINNTTMKYYHLWGSNDDLDRQVLEIIEKDETGMLYSLNWANGPVIESVPIIGNEIYKTEILQKEEGKAGFYVITEQIAERSRIYQVFLWESGELREVFIDEYRDYSLIDEEAYLTGDQYNTYRCVINGNVLIMKGARLIMDAEGNVCEVDTEPRKFQYVNGYFEPVENAE